MKLAILSRAPRAYSTQRLRTAALDRGHQVRVLNTLRFAIDLSGPEPDLQFRGRPISDYDAVLPRIGNSITYFGTAVVRQFEQMDVYTPNTANGISNARDKLRAAQILSRHKIGMPATTFVRNRADVMPAIERVGGAPVVIKLLEGTQGIGVILAPDIKIAEAIIETLHSTKQNVLIQSFVTESRGRDIRALVVGDRVVAAMRRRASGDEFRSNVHRGGTVEAVELTPEYEQAAVRSAQIMGLRVAGVDMLEGNDGPLVMEVNSSPGLEGIEAATKLDVAGAIIDHIAGQVAFPEIDVRQRLTVSTGYGVAELVVHAGADIIGKTIGDSGLEERDLQVLTLHRGTERRPQPAAPRRARGRGPAAVLRPPRGDALDDPGAPAPPRQGAQAAERPDPHRRLTERECAVRPDGVCRHARWRMPSAPGRDVDLAERLGDGPRRASALGQPHDGTGSELERHTALHPEGGAAGEHDEDLVGLDVGDRARRHLPDADLGTRDLGERRDGRGRHTGEHLHPCGNLLVQGLGTHVGHEERHRCRQCGALAG